MHWQSCEMSKPFDPLLLNMMVDALYCYHFSDLGVGNHVSSGLFDSNNDIKRHHSRLCTISSMRSELSPIRTLEWP